MDKSQQQDWHSIAQEYLALYQSIPAAASDRIANHQQKVTNRINRAGKKLNLYFANSPQEKPVCKYLPQVLKAEENYSSKSLLDLISRVKDTLTWEYGYDELPADLKANYAYAELLGPQGPIVGQGLILGLVLLAPDCIYPEHSHDEITESYIVLKGTVALNDRGVFTAGSLIYNSPGQKHELSTGEQPCLLAYAWTAEGGVLKSNSMTWDS